MRPGTSHATRRKPKRLSDGSDAISILTLYATVDKIQNEPLPGKQDAIQTFENLIFASGH